MSADSRDGMAVAATSLLAASNVMTNRVLPPPAYVPWNLGLAAALVGLARRAGCDASSLGMDAGDLERGLRGGAAGTALVALGYAGLLASEPGRAVFQDERVTSLPTATAWWHVLARIPLGTALAEEVAFRGVLPAILDKPGRPSWAPGAISSVLFGLWHILPARDLQRQNAAVAGVASGRSAAVVLAAQVGAMTIAGGVLHALRRRTGHLAAPVAVHAATNVLGFAGARLVGARRGRPMVVDRGRQ